MSEQVEKALSGLVQLRAHWISNVAVKHCGCSVCDAIRLCASEVDAEITLLRTRLEKLLEAGQGVQDALYGNYHTGKHADICTDCQAYLAWDAALAELAGKESGK